MQSRVRAEGMLRFGGRRYGFEVLHGFQLRRLSKGVSSYVGPRIN